MSSRSKTVAAITVAALVLIAGLFVAWRVTSGRPSNQTLLAHLTQQLGAGRLVFTDVARTVQPMPDGSVVITYQASAATPEPLYVAMDAADFLTRQLQIDTTKLRAARAALDGASAARVRELAGPPPAVDDPLQAIVLHQSAAQGTTVDHQGSLLARRAPAGWYLELKSGRFLAALPEGQPRASFGAKTYLENDAADQAALRQLASHQTVYAEQVMAAREKVQDEIRREREQRRARFLATLQPGALFIGSAVNRHDHTSVALSLEITELGSANQQVTALLRNDGGWSDARTFQGEWREDADAEHFSLVLGTRYNQAVRGAGPLLDASDNWTLNLTVANDGSLAAQTQSFDYKFSLVPSTDSTRVRAELTASHRTALEATAANLVYIGAAISKNQQASERVLLRFTQQQNDGALLSARFESPERTDWQRPLSGSLQTNRYRSGDQPIRMLMSGEGRARRAASDRSVFGYTWDLNPAFRIEGDTLIGEDNAFTYRFTRATAEELATLQRQIAEREQRFLSLVKAGAAYDGTTKDREGFSSRLRLRIKRVDARDGTLSASFESREQNGIHHEVSGSFDIAEGVLRLGSSGGGRFNPSGVLKVPFFSRDDTFKFVLHLQETGFYGESSGWGWTLEFPVARRGEGNTSRAENAGTDSGYPEFPTDTGVYALVEGKWVLLPKNGGKVTYGLGNIFAQLNGTLEALSNDPKAKEIATRPDKIASLTFAGSEPLPAVDRKNVVLIYVGPVKRAPADMVQKYPTLADEPDIEIAPTRRLGNGNRQVDLLRIAPGLGGFHSQRVAALVEEAKPGVLLHVCTAAVPAGTYAVSASEQAFEFRAR